MLEPGADGGIGRLRLRKGPVFTNLLLGDEINRAPAKTQSALLEVMQERQVTLEGQTVSLPRPFMVLATQNPIDSEGTYPLPEAQRDRFLFKIDINFPSQAEEVDVVKAATGQQVGDALPLDKVQRCLSADDVARLQRTVSDVLIDDRVIDYAVRLARATRGAVGLGNGGAPARAARSRWCAARAAALIQGREFATPDDVKRQVPPALRHRVMLVARTRTLPKAARSTTCCARDRRRAGRRAAPVARSRRVARLLLREPPHRHRPGAGGRGSRPSPELGGERARPAGRARRAVVAGIAFGTLLLAFIVDVAWSAWLLRRHPLAFERQLPSAFALGQPHGVVVTLVNEGARPWRLQLFDHVPSTMTLRLLPADVAVPARGKLDVRYEITATQRGKVVFDRAAVRVRSRLGLADLQLRTGATQSLQVYPNFAAVSRYAWLAGDRRLAEIGIKTYAARGSGTDFKQLWRTAARHAHAPHRLERVVPPSPRRRARVPGRPRPGRDVPARLRPPHGPNEQSGNRRQPFLPGAPTRPCCSPTSR